MEFIEQDTLKYILIVTSLVLSLYKSNKIRDSSNLKHKKPKICPKFLKEIYTSSKSGSEVDGYILEKEFQSSLNFIIPKMHIQFLLKYSTPSFNINDYKTGYKHFSIDTNKDEIKLIGSKPKAIGASATYFILCFISVIIFWAGIVTALKEDDLKTSLLILLLTSVLTASFIIFIHELLKYIWGYQSATRLVNRINNEITSEQDSGIKKGQGTKSEKKTANTTNNRENLS